MIGHALEVMRPLEHGDVLGEVFLVDAPEGPQEVAQPGPNPFHGVAMHFADAVPVVVPGVFPLRVADRAVPPARGRHPVVGRRFVGVERRVLPGLGLHFRLDRVLAGVVAHRQADLPAVAAHDALDRRPVVRHRAFPLPLVGPASRRVFGVAVRIALFSGVLEGLVGLGDLVRQGGSVLALQGRRLHLVPVRQQRAVVALQFVGELLGRRALYEAAQDQHHLGAGIVRARPHRAREQVEHLPAGPAAVVHHRRPVAHVRALIPRKPVPKRAVQAVRMQYPHQGVVAPLFVKQVGDRETHHGKPPLLARAFCQKTSQSGLHSIWGASSVYRHERQYIGTFWL